MIDRDDEPCLHLSMDEPAPWFAPIVERVIIFLIAVFVGFVIEPAYWALLFLWVTGQLWQGFVALWRRVLS